MVVLGEERLNWFVEGCEEQVLVVEPREGPTRARSDSREPIWRRKELFETQALVGREPVDRVVRSRAEQL
jgi:hypothetical protein